MPRFLDELLHVHAVIAERRFCLRAHSTQGRGNLITAMDKAHSFATTAGRGFEHYRETDVLGGFNNLVLTAQHISAGNDRYASLLHNGASGDLITHLFDRSRRGTDKDDASLLAG